MGVGVSSFGGHTTDWILASYLLAKVTFFIVMSNEPSESLAIENESNDNNIHNNKSEDNPKNIQPLKTNLSVSESNLLTKDEIEWYSRQMILPEISLSGQNKLKKAKVLIIGAGGISSPAAIYLCGAGIGTIGIIDGDKVESSNLHRQIIHNRNTLDMPKVESAKIFLESYNPFVKVETYYERFTQSNAQEIVKNYDIVLDGSDNALTRY